MGQIRGVDRAQAHPRDFVCWRACSWADRIGRRQGIHWIIGGIGFAGFGLGDNGGGAVRPLDRERMVGGAVAGRIKHVNQDVMPPLGFLRIKPLRLDQTPIAFPWRCLGSYQNGAAFGQAWIPNRRTCCRRRISGCVDKREIEGIEKNNLGIGGFV